jgi:hypothetical protein
LCIPVLDPPALRLVEQAAAIGGNPAAEFGNSVLNRLL